MIATYHMNMNSMNDINRRTVDPTQDVVQFLNERLKQQQQQEPSQPLATAQATSSTSMCSFPKAITSSPERHDLSQRLGKLLALAAGKDAAHMDKKTMQQTLLRLQSVMEKRRGKHAKAAVQKSKQQKPTPPSSSIVTANNNTSTNNRRQILIDTVGASRASQIVALTREIQVLKLRRRDLLLARSHRVTACTGGSCSANLLDLKPQQGGKLPEPVKDLFFRTALVDALEKTPVQALAQLPWEALYQQGQKHVQAYRNWLQLSQPPSRRPSQVNNVAV